ncbi:MAG: Ribosome-binding ATPase YchF [Chloroflexi bacterium]|nr:Ribosome-binding ATPase YchF [Chloroflexota bacterium]
MPLSIGIIGLPNVGKSTTFNALTQAQNAEVANYPFCTIEPNKAVVPVPDTRVEELAEFVGVDTVIHATVEFLDIAGLVEGASRGEGLGNQFLGNVRDADALVHVVRCFDDPNVVHVRENPEPVADIEIINVELALADLEQLERKIERLHRQVKGDKNLRPRLETAQQMRDHLQTGRPLSTFPQQANHHYQALAKEMRFLTSKPVIYAANVNESDLAEDSAYVRAVRQIAQEEGAEVVKLCALLEQEMIDMTPEEQGEFLELAGAEESGLKQVIHKGFETLNLISFFTFNKKEARAWNIPKGSTAPEAAGAIHTDFQRGFIRAEVTPFPTFAEYGSSAAVKSAGKMRLEGKEYVVQDGDVIYFRFNV